MQRSWRALAAVAALLAVATPLGAQLMPDAPVEDFKLYGFEEGTGWRIWQLEGSSGRYIGEGQVEVKDMILTTFQGNDQDRPQLRIESPLAQMTPSRHAASGPGEIAVIGRTFYVSGEGWKWDGSENVLQIFNSAHVVIQADLGALLK